MSVIAEVLFWVVVALWIAFFAAWLTMHEPEYIVWMIISDVVLIILFKISGG